MKVCFYVGGGIVFEPIASAVRDVFTEGLNLGSDSLDKWRISMGNADLVLVHLTGWEPTALIAWGMAQGLEKRTVLFCPTREVIPTPLTNRPAIIHGWNIDFLRNELKKLRDTPQATNDSEGTAADKFHNLFGDLLKQYGYEHTGVVEMEGTTFTLREQEMDLALVQKIANRAKSLNVRVRLL